MGLDGVADHDTPPREGVAMTDPVDHRRLAVDYFNAAWALIDKQHRTAEDDLTMVATAAASRQHWVEAGGTDENLTIADWQVAHAASHAGLGDVATAFATAAYDRARRADLATWLQASTAEGRARAAATTGDRASYEKFAQECRDLLAQVADDEDRKVIEDQLGTIPQ